MQHGRFPPAKMEFVPNSDDVAHSAKFYSRIHKKHSVQLGVAFTWRLFGTFESFLPRQRRPSWAQKRRADLGIDGNALGRSWLALLREEFDSTRRSRRGQGLPGPRSDFGRTVKSESSILYMRPRIVKSSSEKEPDRIPKSELGDSEDNFARDGDVFAHNRR